MPTKEPILTPELKRIMKIFFLASLGIVFLFSFFNEYRADNSGDDKDSRITASSKLYFKNVRQFYYDIEKNEEAKLDIYRLDKRLKDKNLLFINLSIIISRLKDKAYIYVEPCPILQNLDPISIKWTDKVLQKEGTLAFKLGDRTSHLRLVEELYPLIKDGTEFEVETNQQWKSILVSEKERYVFKVTAEDYFRLVE